MWIESINQICISILHIKIASRNIKTNKEMQKQNGGNRWMARPEIASPSQKYIYIKTIMEQKQTKQKTKQKQTNKQNTHTHTQNKNKQ